MFIGHLISLFASTSVAFAAVAVPASESVVQARAADATTIPGTIRNSGSTFIATFAADGTTHTFRAVYSPPTPSWSSSHAVLNFNNESQLMGPGTFVGTVGRAEVNLQLKFGGSAASLTGPLDSPLPSAQPIAGNGIWTSSQN